MQVMLYCDRLPSATTDRVPRRSAEGDGSPVASPPKAEVESGATMIGKPFGERGFRRQWRQRESRTSQPKRAAFGRDD